MNLIEHLKRQIAFSRATFGPGARTAGICDHIAKEITEEIVPEDREVGHYEAASEFVDVVLLGLDGMWRSLEAAGYDWDHIPAKIAEMLEAKQSKNERRIWPDWRTVDQNKAIEHLPTKVDV